MKVRRIDPQEKIDNVIFTARRLFVEHGFHRVTIPMIVRESGVSTGAIYHHFDNKEHLARTIYDRTLNNFHMSLVQRLVGANDTLAKLRVFGQLVIDVAENDPEMMRYMLFLNHGEFLSACPPICSSAPFRWVQETIRQGVASGSVGTSHPLVAAGAFTGVILRNIELCYQGVLSDPLGAIAPVILDHALRAIRV